MKRIDNMTGAEAAKFIRNHKGKFYVDTVTFGGHDMVRVPVVKSDLAYTLEAFYGDSDGIAIFEDDAGSMVLGYTC